jgi:pimeloyl-ACP methyl ester carboxylesterase
MAFEARQIQVNGLNIRYLTAGNDEPPLVLLHGVGDSAFDWSWVIPTLGTKHRVIAPDFPGSGDSAKPKREYSLEFLTQFLGDFLNTLQIQRAVLLGNSLGGLIALRFALSNPQQVAAMVLVSTMGFSQLANLVLSNLTLPIFGEFAIAWSKTPLGAKQRAWSRAALLFAHPSKVPAAWLAEQERLALLPGFLEANLSILRYLLGQRQEVLESLPQLQMPTLVVWGVNDLVLPNYQADQDAINRLQQAHLALIPDCGHLPQVERPELFTNAVKDFLVTCQL